MVKKTLRTVTAEITPEGQIKLMVSGCAHIPLTPSAAFILAQKLYKCCIELADDQQALKAQEHKNRW